MELVLFLAARFLLPQLDTLDMVTPLHPLLLYPLPGSS